MEKTPISEHHTFRASALYKLLLPHNITMLPWIQPCAPPQHASVARISAPRRSLRRSWSSPPEVSSPLLLSMLYMSWVPPVKNKEKSLTTSLALRHLPLGRVVIDEDGVIMLPCGCPQ
eukprot:scaffold90425_cov17-Tisochrysis_lutea.AAC.2